MRATVEGVAPTGLSLWGRGREGGCRRSVKRSPERREDPSTAVPQPSPALTSASTAVRSAGHTPGPLRFSPHKTPLDWLAAAAGCTAHAQRTQEGGRSTARASSPSEHAQRQHGKVGRTFPIAHAPRAQSLSCAHAQP